MNQTEAGSFTDAAMQWCCVAARLLGWRPHEFWSATPVELLTALQDPSTIGATTPPGRDLIAQMMERDSHG